VSELATARSPGSRQNSRLPKVPTYTGSSDADLIFYHAASVAWLIYTRPNFFYFGYFLPPPLPSPPSPLHAPPSPLLTALAPPRAAGRLPDHRSPFLLVAPPEVLPVVPTAPPLFHHPCPSISSNRLWSFHWCGGDSIGGGDCARGFVRRLRIHFSSSPLSSIQGTVAP